MRLHEGKPTIFVETWSDLTPFQQGAVEAALRDAQEALWEDYVYGLPADQLTDMGKAWHFRHLAPATLARIMADCERLKVQYPSYRYNMSGGRKFWLERQAKIFEKESNLPPLTLHLADDGLIHIKEDQ